MGRILARTMFPGPSKWTPRQALSRQPTIDFADILDNNMGLTRSSRQAAVAEHVAIILEDIFNYFVIHIIVSSPLRA
jgi:hypothetical protein